MSIHNGNFIASDGSEILLEWYYVSMLGGSGNITKLKSIVICIDLKTAKMVLSSVCFILFIKVCGP